MKNNSIFLMIIGVILLGGLFFIFKPKQEAVPQSTTQIASPSATVDPKIKTFELKIEDKKLVSGQDTLSVNEGDEITIEIISDEAEEFHLHGYDKSVDLEPNKAAEIKFTANLTGRFVFELEHSKTEIGALEVQPKQ